MMNATLPPELISIGALDAVDRPTADATGMPNAAYTEHALFEFERDHLFAAGWTAIAFCADHADDQTATPIDWMGLPLFIVGDKGGAPRVFHNVCSHRGTRLLDAPKKTNGLLVCPYHAWSYDLSGALRATPHIGGVGINELPGFARKQHGLKIVRSHCWMGVVFVNLSGEAAPFAQHAAPLDKHYQKFIGVEGAQSMRAAHTDAGLTLQADCNWKLAVENYCEAYHLPWIHPALNSYSPLERHYCIELSDDFAGQGSDTFTPTLPGANALPLFAEWPQGKQKIAEYPVFYPNLLLGYQVNHFYALIIHPLAANRTREELKLFYIEDGATDDAYAPARKANLAAWRKVFEEDISAIEGMQYGRNSPGFGGGAFSPVMDAPTHHFHRWVARRYRAALSL